MKSHTFSSEGIVLGRKNFGESDRIISILSKDRGRVALIAKGVRRLTSKKRGHLEVFSHIKFQAIATGGLSIISEVETVDDYKEIRKSLAKVSLAYYFVEVIGKSTNEEEKNDKLYKLISTYFSKLRNEKKLKTLRKDFIYDIVTCLGFWPDGKVMSDPDDILENIVEKKMYSRRIGKKVLE